MRARALRSVLLAVGIAGCGGSGGGGGVVPPYGLASREPVTTLTFPLAAPQAGSVVAVDAFPGLPSFANPLFATHAPAGADRVFVLEQSGRILVFPNSPGATVATTFLDLRSRVRQTGGEEGLLGLAFHPDYATNGYFYVNYTDAAPAPRQSVVARYRVSSDPDVAETAETRLLVVPQPFSNHNGGMLAFGPDGMLHASFGDGGSAGDPQNNGLSLTTLLGKVLRIDVDSPGGGLPYGIPADNPFASSGGPERKEIWCWGLRNPWRFSFDRVSGTPWCGDVGQGDREEVDVLRNGGNFGWRAMEGNLVFDEGQMSRGPFDAPVVDYGRAAGTCVIGGYVYRGTRVPSLYGAYVYADNGSGRVWALTWDGTSVTAPPVQITTIGGVSSFGEDRSGEMLVCGHGSGRLYRLSPASPGGQPVFPALLSETGIFADPVGTLTPEAGLVPYDANVPLWSDGAVKDRLMALPGSERIGWTQDGPWTFPAGTVLVKTFRLPLVAGDPSSAAKVETRVLILGNAGWDGYSYRWRDDGSDADLLADADARTFTIADPAAPGGTRQQTWTFPSRGDCMRCHTAAAGRVLGLTTRQLNRTFDYGSIGGVADNQLRTWNHIGLFDAATPPASALPAFPAPSDAGQPVAARARAVLDVNCSMCHRPGGPESHIDLRAGVAVADMGIVGVPPQHGGMGLADPLIVRSGDRNGSVLHLRMRDLGAFRMPPLASSVVDEEAVDLVGRWIDAGP